MLGYQPQPTWTGQDFYSAHALGGDPMLYHNTISRFSPGMAGFAKHEAKMWHYRAYGGLGEVTHMGPQEVGAAAAYEAYRQIKYGSGMYQVLYGDYDRQREALRGMAIAEVVRLWHDTGRGFDQYGMQAASDAAAQTAYHIATQQELEEGMGMGMGGMGFGGSYRDRRNSFAGYAGSSGLGGGSVYGGGGSVYGGGGSVYGGGSPLMSSSPIPVPGSPYSHMGGGYAGSMGSMAGYPSSFGGFGGGYAGSFGGGYGSPGYDVGGLQVGFPMGGYAGSLPGSPQAIIIPPPSDGHSHGHRHRHRRHHHHHRRHRSHDRY